MEKKKNRQEYIVVNCGFMEKSGEWPVKIATNRLSNNKNYLEAIIKYIPNEKHRDIYNIVKIIHKGREFPFDHPEILEFYTLIDCYDTFVNIVEGNIHEIF